MIKLVYPSKRYEEAITDFKEEFISYGEDTIPGSELLDKMDSIDEWIEYVNNNRKEKSLSEDWVLSDCFIAVDEGDSVVGIIVLRHDLNDFLRDFGHIGFSVRPSKRRMGIATIMLQKVLEVAKNNNLSELQLSCMDSNIASKKCIISNGGVFLRNFNYLDESASVYIIKI
ncbi:MAG: hypothetical protein BZ137_01935 [Methanosphaera sp. rholeuAM130]|nr:GNAT family N-acetyltransferase [Methanosphaera sp.]RAP54501.1 MAG: hypothetical protein BZ137_01935 [Methanosphaera sp. rholeuAM130]